MQQTVSWLVMGAGALALLLSGCSSPSATFESSTATPTPSGRVDVGGHSLFYTCAGQGSPTVILEAGGGGDSTSWAKVLSGVAETTRVCAYDRANLGGSGPSPKPRTIEDAARDLEALLAAARFDAPYVLVGHSISGELARVFADQHPGQVAGMVLVDAAHPDKGRRMLAGPPPASANEPETAAFWRQLFTWISDSSGSSFPNPEGWDTQASHAQVRAVAPLGDLPLVVISQSPDKPLFLSNTPLHWPTPTPGCSRSGRGCKRSWLGCALAATRSSLPRLVTKSPTRNPS